MRVADKLKNCLETTPRDRRDAGATVTTVTGKGIEIEKPINVEIEPETGITMLGESPKIERGNATTSSAVAKLIKNEWRRPPDRTQRGLGTEVVGTEKAIAPVLLENAMIEDPIASLGCGTETDEIETGHATVPAILSARRKRLPGRRLQTGRVTEPETGENESGNDPQCGVRGAPRIDQETPFVRKMQSTPNEKNRIRVGMMTIEAIPVEKLRPVLEPIGETLNPTWTLLLIDSRTIEIARQHGLLHQARLQGPPDLLILDMHARNLIARTSDLPAAVRRLAWRSAWVCPAAMGCLAEEPRP